MSNKTVYLMTLVLNNQMPARKSYYPTLLIYITVIFAVPENALILQILILTVGASKMAGKN
jgi:hypothetical protein